MSARGAEAPGVMELPGMERFTGTAAPAPERAPTAEQEQAIARRGEPLLVSAAAGSGKTSVLVERFIGAVREDGTAPGRILAITFTERAAGELRSRVRERLLELGDRAAARDTEAAFVGTFHAFCARLLRAHPLAAGLPPDFAILDEGLAGRMRGAAFTVALEGFLASDRADAVDLLAAYGVDRTRRMIERIHAELRSRGQRTPRLPPGGAGERGDPERAAWQACELLDELLGRFAAAYEASKRERAAADFDDLELLAGELLREHDGMRRAWSERFELLMVDEFQDTNPRQLAILRALARDNLFTVGDELQSIYGFRHADVGLFRERRAELGARGGSIALTVNFRAREPLLEAVNAVFAERFSGYEPLVAGRGAESASGSDTGTPPAVELLLTGTAGWEEHEELAASLSAGLPDTQRWRQAEARLLARRVRELVDSGVASAGDVAVLMRATGDIEVFERALQLEGLRTLAAVGSFWGRQQVRDLVAYLRAVANPRDEVALYGALASPLCGCSLDGLALLARAVAEEGRPAWQTALGAGAFGQALAEDDRAALATFCERLARERETASRRTISQLIERAIEDSGYREHLLTLDWGERRLANVHKLLRLARGFEASEGRDLRAFLDHVEHLEESVAPEPDAPVEGVEPDTVRLMTVHAAKGLEFPVVCVADLGRQPNVFTPDLLVEGDRIGVRLAGLDGQEPVKALDYEALASERREREAEEEDRILYVAMTRARERLLLSGSIDLARPPRLTGAYPPLYWLAPALCPELPALLAGGVQEPVHDLEVRNGAARLHCVLSTPADAEQLLGVACATGEAPPPPETPSLHRASPQPAAKDAMLSPEGQEPATARPAPQRLAPLGEDPATVSYTSLSERERCGYRYYLERVLGLPEERPAARRSSEGALDPRARGTLVHRLLELVDFRHLVSPDEADVGGTARALGLEVGAREAAEVAALIAAALDAPTAERLARAEEVRREHAFAFAPAGSQPLVTGVMDVLAREADGCLLVVDYKSDRVEASEPLEEAVERDYGLQRLIYALAVLRDGAPAVEVAHWYLERPAEPVAARFTAAEVLELEERLLARLARARARGFAVSEQPHRGLCLTCPGRFTLCSWDESATMREHPGDAPADGAPEPSPG